MTEWSGGAPSSPVWHHEALEEMSREGKHITGCKYAAAWPDGCMLRDHRATQETCAAQQSIMEPCLTL